MGRSGEAISAWHYCGMDQEGGSKRRHGKFVDGHPRRFNAHHGPEAFSRVAGDE
jgi:hypothetical protein